MKTARNVIISGLTAAGKTTHSKMLCEQYGLKYVSASQILLNLAGLPPEQPLDFWVTSEGREISKRISWDEIDNESRRIESEADETVFDCQTLPWLCSKRCLVLWIESSLPSRIMKAIVSYNGKSRLNALEVEKGITSKDRFAQEQIFVKYGVDLFQDRAPFNFIIDISSFITAPTEEASLSSITNAHKIISSAVGWYLYNDISCLDRVRELLITYGSAVILRYP